MLDASSPTFKLVLPIILIALCLAGCSETALVPERPAPVITLATQPPELLPPPSLSEASPSATAQASHPASTPTLALTPTATDPAFGVGYGPRGFPAEINPLTGLTVAQPSLLDRRPMVIKITNFPRSVRPQWGLAAADHVYEYYLEDELTRFIGVFYGQDASRVGPIRSARPFDEHIVRMYKAIFAFGYADDRVIDPLVESDLRNFLVIERPNNCPPLCRIGPENAYNTLFTDTQQLSQYITERGTNNERQDLDGLRFEEKSLLVLGGGQVNRLNIRYSSESYNYWEYDPETQRYLRWQDLDRKRTGEEVYAPLFDNLTSQQIAADNIILLMVPAGYYFKSNSTEIFDFALKGTGKAYALRQGKTFEIRWIRPHKGALISLAFPNSEAYPLKPGNIWFEVLSDTSTFTYADQTWSFTFDLP